MNTASHPYDIALSFAGEDRVHALALATRLQRAGLRVFFDRFEELWGNDLSERLHEVYDRQCRRVVVFVSQAYLQRPWTNFERRVLISRALREDPGFLLPLRLDDAELPGLPGVIAYKDLRQDGVDDVAHALVRMCGGARSAPSPVRLSPADFLYVVADAKRPRAAAFNIVCHISNDTDRSCSLQHLEASVTPQGHQPVQYQWKGCFSLDTSGTQPAMWGSDEGLPLALRAGESRLLGVCLEAGPLPPALAWGVGRYDVRLSAWVDVPPRLATADVCAVFESELTADVAAQLMWWFSPPPGLVMQVPVAVPLRVVPQAHAT